MSFGSVMSAFQRRSSTCYAVPMRTPSATQARIKGSVFGFVLLLTSLMIDAAQGHSSQRPFWTEQAMFQFGEELYFVGVASCARTREEGRNRAFDNALDELRDYAQDRDTSRLFIDTQMIYEEPQSPSCPEGTTSVWRLLRVDRSKLTHLPRRQMKPAREWSTPARKPPSNPKPAELLLEDLTPQAGMSRTDIKQRFGSPLVARHEGPDEIWEYSDIGLSITFSPDETLINWKFDGSRTGGVPSDEPPARERRHEVATPPTPSRPVMLVPELPRLVLPKNPVTEGRELFNGKGGCNICHGRDADMFTDVKPDILSGSPPGYVPPLFTPLGGVVPRRVPTDLRDWSVLKFRTDLEMARAIKNGIAGTSMTATRHLSDKEIAALVAYLNSIR